MRRRGAGVAWRDTRPTSSGTPAESRTTGTISASHACRRAVPTGRGVPFWEHSGYWGLSSFHVPELETSVALVVTGRIDATMLGELRSDVVRTLAAEPP